jgi:hypothetical protein
VRLSPASRPSTTQSTDSLRTNLVGRKVREVLAGSSLATMRSSTMDPIACCWPEWALPGSGRIVYPALSREIPAAVSPQ